MSRDEIVETYSWITEAQRKVRKDKIAKASGLNMIAMDKIDEEIKRKMQIQVHRNHERLQRKKIERGNGRMRNKSVVSSLPGGGKQRVVRKSMVSPMPAHLVSNDEEADFENNAVQRQQSQYDNQNDDEHMNQ